MVQQQQHLQQQLEASEARLTTQHSLDDAVLITDLTGILTLVNAAAAQLCGFAPEDLLGCALRPASKARSRAPIPRGTRPSGPDATGLSPWR
ncbi:MAG: PAS domain-containing protein [Chloroflexales bacterium]|nr:PAS domain-containing protein [Chloroflexales bacterium]